MAEISVAAAGANEYTVTVREEDDRTEHLVTIADEDFAWLGAEGAAPQDVLEESFRFMLEREPKEAILGRFELRTIARYFPEYPEEMRRRLGE